MGRAFLLLAFLAIGAIVALSRLRASDDVRSGSSADIVPSNPPAAAAPLDDPIKPENELAGVPSNAEEQQPRRATVTTPRGTLVVSGSVIDADRDVPMPGVEVNASINHPDLRDSLIVTRSDEQGRYSIELDVPAGARWAPGTSVVHLVAVGEGVPAQVRMIQESEIRVDPQDPHRCRATHDFLFHLRVEPDPGSYAVMIRGSVVRESDRLPIAGGDVLLLALEPAPKEPRPIAEATTDDRGRFLITHGEAEPGDLALFASASGFLGRISAIELALLGETDAGVIALGTGFCIEGIVTTAPGASEVWAYTASFDGVWFEAKEQPWMLRDGSVVRQGARSPIGPDGRFRLCGLGPEEYALGLGYSGCALGSSESIHVLAPATGVTFERLRCTYRLRILDARTGSVVKPAEIRFEDSGSSCYIGSDDVIAIDPGIEHPCRIVAEGYRPLQVALPALEAGQLREFEFRMDRFATLVVATIVVLSPEGRPVEELVASIRSVGGGSEASGPMSCSLHSWDGDGRFKLPRLAPGAYLVEIGPQRGPDLPHETWLDAVFQLDVQEGMEPVELRLEEGGFVSARASKDDGTPVQAGTRLLSGLDSELAELEWDLGGGLHSTGFIPKGINPRLFLPLPAGPCTIRFGADGFLSRDVVVQIVAGETVPIEVTLEPQPPR